MPPSMVLHRLLRSSPARCCPPGLMTCRTALARSPTRASVATANPGSAAAPAHLGLRMLCRSNCAAVPGSPSKPTNYLARAGPPLLPESRSRSSSPSRSADVTCGSSAAWVATRARPKPRVSRTPEPMVALLNRAGERDRTPRCAVGTRAAGADRHRTIRRHSFDGLCRKSTLLRIAADDATRSRSCKDNAVEENKEACAAHTAMVDGASGSAPPSD